MDKFIFQLLYCSFAMAIITLFYTLVVTFSKKQHSPKGFYYTGVVILAGYLIPFRPNITLPASMKLSFREFNTTDPLLHNSFVSPLRSFNQTRDNITIARNDTFLLQSICFLWLIGAIGVLVHHIIRYIYFIKTVRRWSIEIIDDQMLATFDEAKAYYGISSHIKLMNCSCISSPMLISLMHPTILLPDIYLSTEELKLVLSHELVHFKRKDLFIKGALILSLAINWFNPAIYLFSKVFTHFCEISCDETVTENLSESVRYQYVLVIMRVAHGALKSNTVFSTYFYGGKENMKNRISFIMRTSNKRMSIALLSICFILTLSTKIAFAANSEEFMNTSNDRKSSFLVIKTNEEIEKEMAESFSIKYSNDFDENDFPEMIITYDEDGIPMVTNPSNSFMREAVIATTKHKKNGFYSSSDCSNSSLVFWTLKGASIQVIDSSNTTTVAKVKCGDYTGYIKKSDLKF
ncbi:MAG: M56 family metallopeptidase [Candidatus Galacturonibacter soehngenii]|nr:M56 family metallopeptidase [Candidatus Galacturonibacter soehngenii]